MRYGTLYLQSLNINTKMLIFQKFRLRLSYTCAHKSGAFVLSFDVTFARIFSQLFFGQLLVFYNLKVLHCYPCSPTWRLICLVFHKVLLLPSVCMSVSVPAFLWFCPLLLRAHDRTVLQESWYLQDLFFVLLCKFSFTHLHKFAVFEPLSFLNLKPSYEIPGFPRFVLKCSILRIEI